MPDKPVWQIDLTIDAAAMERARELIVAASAMSSLAVPLDRISQQDSAEVLLSTFAATAYIAYRLAGVVTMATGVSPDAAIATAASPEFLGPNCPLRGVVDSGPDR